MDLLVAKHLGSLRPVDDAGTEVLRSIKQGEVLRVEIKRPRNVRFHRLFFGLLNLVYENVEGYKSVEHLLTHVKIGIGHADAMIAQDGTTIWHPRSISFAKMDEESFRAFWNKAVDFIVLHILPVEKAELEREVFELLGINLDNAA